MVFRALDLRVTTIEVLPIRVDNKKGLKIRDKTIKALRAGSGYENNFVRVQDKRINTLSSR